MPPHSIYPCTPGNRFHTSFVSAAPRSPSFSLPAPIVREWRTRIRHCLDHDAATPFFVFAAAPYERAVRTLETLDFSRPSRHWLSAKTQPLPALWQWWQQRGGSIEVVSEFEFRGALADGFETDRILVNGPAKSRWLPALARPGLRVNFDSLNEVRNLLPLARSQRWRVGLRLRTPGEVDPGHPEFPTQFGLEPDEAATALRQIQRAGLELDAVHFHLRTQVPHAREYAAALASVSEWCARAGAAPRVLDLGGGLPAPRTWSPDGRPFDAGFRLAAYAEAIRRAVRRMPSVQEIWLENGRHLSAGAGALVVRVLDMKERAGWRLLICDGGRTLNAMVSTWEAHALMPLEARAGRRIPTAVHGPTCMAFDCLGRRPLPASLRCGDHLIWFEAGAYHLPWENRFSHGLAEVWWEDDRGLRRVRRPESFEEYRAMWTLPR